MMPSSWTSTTRLSISCILATPPSTTLKGSGGSLIVSTREASTPCGPTDEGYISVVEQAFASCEAHVITFPNPLTGGQAASTVYVATVGHG